MVIGELTDGDVDALIARHPLSADGADRARRFGRGHPLALEMLGEAVARHGDLDLADGPPGEVVEALFEVLMEDLDPAERRTVEAASILRRVTRPLLSAVLDRDGQDVDAAWRTLRELPFTSVTPFGLELDPLARNVIAGGLEIREPGYVADVRRRAATAVLRDAGGGQSWDATADLLNLVQNPVIRNSYLPPGDQQHPVEPAVSDDREAILAITEQYDGHHGAVAVEHRWKAHQGGFVGARGSVGEVTAYSAVVRLSELDKRLTASDPAVAAVLNHLRQHPLPPMNEALLHRRALGRRRGERPSPELGAMVVDVLMAQAWPRSTFTGFDLDERAITVARSRATDAGAAAGVSFTVADATGFGPGPYDVVAFFDALHDLGDPIAVLRRAHELLTPGGIVVAVEPWSTDRLDDSIGNPIARLNSAISTSMCTPTSLAQPGAFGLGTSGGPTRRLELLTAAGFVDARVAADAGQNPVLTARVAR